MRSTGIGYLFRATRGGISRVAGLAAIDDVEGLENVDVTSFVAGHMGYRTAMPRLLRHVGWEVESDEFAEITDPDPDNHEARQRELIREIEDARKDAQAKPEKRRFGFFKRGKLAEKKSWEMYDEKMGGEPDRQLGTAESPGKGVLFDIEAIKKELESEHMEVKQLESTLPPMRIDLNNTNGVVSTVESVESSATSSQVSQAGVSEATRSKSFNAAALGSDAKNEATQSAPSISVSSHDNPKESSAARGEEPTNHESQGQSSLPSAVLAWQESQKAPVRPELKSNNTMPAEKNAWVDEEEEVEWGKERDVVMSFE